MSEKQHATTRTAETLISQFDEIDDLLSIFSNNEVIDAAADLRKYSTTVAMVSPADLAELSTELSRKSAWAAQVLPQLRICVALCKAIVDETRTVLGDDVWCEPGNALFPEPEPSGRLCRSAASTTAPGGRSGRAVLPARKSKGGQTVTTKLGPNLQSTIEKAAALIVRLKASKRAQEFQPLIAALKEEIAGLNQMQVCDEKWRKLATEMDIRAKKVESEGKKVKAKLEKLA